MTSVAFVYHSDYLLHDTGEHPERPARVAAIAEAVERARPARPALAVARPATLEQVGRVHTAAREPLARLRRRAAGAQPGHRGLRGLPRRGAARGPEALFAQSRPCSPARCGRLSPPFAQPGTASPGPDSAAGFCLLNNLAVAVRHAQAVHGLPRILVVDFDVHHGNGTRGDFQGECDISRSTRCRCIRAPATFGTPVWARARLLNQRPGREGTGNAEYERIFEEVLAPAARRFQQRAWSVASAGYDAHWLDPLATLAVSTAGFAWMVGRLQASARTTFCGSRSP